MNRHLRNTLIIVPAIAGAAAVVSAVSAARRLDQLHRRIDLTREIWQRISETAALNPSAESSTSKQLAAHIYNDAVRETLRIRSNPLVRGLRLAGTAPLPIYVDFLHGR